MRLINARTLKLEVFNDPVLTPYAILSHTWDGDEVSFEDMQDLEIAQKKTASLSKIEATCRLVLGEGLDYVWVDTCCIDKSSSVELSEAINSMFRWYKDAIYCIVFLLDLPPQEKSIGASDAVKNCRWFSRGWTLQELIAPAIVRFYDADWTFLGTKLGSAKEIEAITGIDQCVLKSLTPLAAISLAKRMSWAAARRTTRIEDMAYCLLGVFDVTMPMLYGEGPRAFTRLQEEILRKTTDLSLFAWRMLEDSEYCGVLAKSPAEFFGCGTIDLNDDQFSFRDEISITNKGVKIHTPLQSVVSEDGIFFMHLHCYQETGGELRNIGIYLKRELDTYFRRWPHQFATAAEDTSTSRPLAIYLAPTSESRTLRTRVETDIYRRIRIVFENEIETCRIHSVKAVPEAFWHGDENSFSIERHRQFICFMRFCVTSRIAAPRTDVPLEESTYFVLVCKLDNSSQMHITLHTEKDLQNCQELGAINPFTRIEDYGPAGDRLRFSILSLGSRQAWSVVVKNKDAGHDYGVKASQGLPHPSTFTIYLHISPTD